MFCFLIHLDKNSFMVVKLIKHYSRVQKLTTNDRKEVCSILSKMKVCSRRLDEGKRLTKFNSYILVILCKKALSRIF